MAGKMGLKVREVTKDHFSSGVKLHEPKFSRFVVRFLEGKSLLASDVVTGKSDPVCFVWCGAINESPDLSNAGSPDSGIMLTAVCPTTVDPIWNEDIVFPLDISDISSLLDLKCAIYVRDEDIIDEVTSYDELGMLEINLKDILTKGKVCKNSLVISAEWYTLLKGPGMRKVDGKIKLTLSLIFASEDSDMISQQVSSAEVLQNSAALANTTTRNSLPLQIQQYMRHIVDPSGALFRDPRTVSPFSRMGADGGRGVSRSSSRESSPLRRSLGGATSSIQSLLSTTSSNIAPMVSRPNTAPSRRGRPGSSGGGRRSNSRPGSATAPARSSAQGRGGWRGDVGGDEYDDGYAIMEDPENESLTVGDAAGAGNGAAVTNSDHDNDDGDEDNMEDELLVLANVGGASAPGQVNVVRRPDDDVRIEVDGADITQILRANPLVNPAGAGAAGEGEGEGEGRQGANRYNNAINNTSDTAISSAGAGQQGQSVPAGTDVLLEDVVRLGVQRVAEEMGAAAPADPVDFSRQFQDTAQRLAGGVDPPAGGYGAASAGSERDPEVVRSNSNSVLNSAGPGDQGVNDADAISGAGTAVPEGKDAMAAGHPPGTEERPESVPELKPSATLPQEKGAAFPTTSALNRERESMLLVEAERELELSASSTAGQGSATAVVRALREMSQQRESMQQSLEAIARVTQSGFSKLSSRLAHMEDTVAAISNGRSGGRSSGGGKAGGGGGEERQLGGAYLGEEGIPFEEMFPDELSREMEPEEGDGWDDDDADGFVGSGHRNATVPSSSSRAGNRNSHSNSHSWRGETETVGAGRSERGVRQAERGSERGRASDRDRGRDRERSSSRGGGKSNGRAASNSPARSAARAGGSGGGGGGDGGSNRSGGRGRDQSSGSNRTGGSGKKFGSSDMIAQAKAQAAQAKRAAAAAAATAASTTGGAVPEAAAPKLDMQLVMKGADGKVIQTQVDSPVSSSPSTQHQKLQQEPGQGPPIGSPASLEDQSSLARNTQLNKHISPYSPNQPAVMGSSAMGGGNYAYGQGDSMMMMSPPQYPAQQLQQQYPPYQYQYQQMAPPPPNMPPQQQQLNHLLNREFGDVLERGGLEDVGNMLENTAPKPEELSTMVRNRLYDAVATLLLQGNPRYTERCLLWTLALVRGGGTAQQQLLQQQLQQHPGQRFNAKTGSNCSSRLLGELVGHTKRDLRDALAQLAQEPSKRGLLASLLKSQMRE